MGKSNVVTALKWLIDPNKLSENGLPSVDLSRTATGITVSLSISMDSKPIIDGLNLGFPIDQGGLVHIRRDFNFLGKEEGDDNNRRIQLLSEYAKPSSLLVFVGTTLENSHWKSFDIASAFFPELVHIRPSDIGQQHMDLSQQEQELLLLKLPEEFDKSDLEWLNDSLNEIFHPGKGHMKYQLSVEPSSRLIAVWDEYGYIVPLRKAGNGITQVVYTLASIVQARKRIEKLSQFGKSMLLCIDEPEQHLSSGIQKSYSRFLKKLSNEFQVIVTSHSGHFLDKDEPLANCVLMRDNRNGTAQLESKYSTHEAIRTVLGIGIDDSLYLGKITILVEGDCDLLAIKQVLRAGFEDGSHQINPDEVTLIARDGASKIPPFVGFVAQLGLPLLVILDNDREAHDAEKNIREQSHVINAPILKIPLEHDRTEAEIEDLLPEDLLIDATIAYLGKYRSIQLTKDDFQNAYNSRQGIKQKKWTQRLIEVLKFHSKLPHGVKIDDFIQKISIFQEVLSSLGTLSMNNVHPFLWKDIPKQISETLDSFSSRNAMTESGVIPNTRAFSWVHPSNMVDHINHDV